MYACMCCVCVCVCIALIFYKRKLVDNWRAEGLWGKLVLHIPSIKHTMIITLITINVWQESKKHHHFFLSCFAFALLVVFVVVVVVHSHYKSIIKSYLYVQTFAIIWRQSLEHDQIVLFRAQFLIDPWNCDAIFGGHVFNFAFFMKFHSFRPGYYGLMPMEMYLHPDINIKWYA